MSLLTAASTNLTLTQQSLIKQHLGTIAKSSKVKVLSIDDTYTYCCIIMAQQIQSIKDGKQIAVINLRTQQVAPLDLPLITSPRQIHRIRNSTTEIEPLALGLHSHQQSIHDNLCAMLGASAGNFAITSVALMQWIIAQQDKGLIIGAIDPKTDTCQALILTMHPPQLDKLEAPHSRL